MSPALVVVIFASLLLTAMVAPSASGPFRFTPFVPILVYLAGRWAVSAVSRAARRQILRPQKVRACLACGYDLTSNVSGVCPECGTPTRQGT